jgi:signal transduction histidine kinase
MRPQELFVQYQEFQRYVGWSEQDACRLRAVFPAVQPHLPALVNDFYHEITRHRSVRKGCAGGETQVARLPGTLLGWLDELFSGNYDARYVSRRWRLGSRQVGFGLSQILTWAGVSRLRDGLSQLIAEHAATDPQEQVATIRSLNKLLDLELELIEEAYRAELVKRQEQTERLAAIGQFSAGVAHELRNPLNVVKTSVYYLLHAENPTPEKVAEHLQRIARQVEVAEAATTALTDFARLQQPCLRPFALEPSLREILETTWLPADIRVGIDCPM